MRLLRGLRRLLPLGRFRRRCLFCRAKLDLSRGTTANVTHLDCPRCGREFDLKAGGRLRQHWRTPLKESLFLASQSSGDLASLSHIQGVWRSTVVDEVKRELAHPSTRLTDLFRYSSPRSESELRAYLRMCVQPGTDEADPGELAGVESGGARVETAQPQER